jgi:hypothetical protein
VDPNGQTDTGSAYVIFGKASGYSDIDLANLSPADGSASRPMICWTCLSGHIPDR